MGPYAEVKSSDFNLRLKMLKELADLQFSEREFQTAGALTQKALADKANVNLGAVNLRLFTDASCHSNNH